MTLCYVVGDPHGHCQKIAARLQEAGIITASGQWNGEDAHLVFMGDYVNNGPNGAGVIQLVRSIQAQAPAKVHALVGNHDLLLIAAFHYRRSGKKKWKSLWKLWRHNGGVIQDLDRLGEDDVEWLRRQPALLKLRDVLFAHADGRFYQAYGDSVEAVNAYFQERLNGKTPGEFEGLLSAFGVHDEFWDKPKRLGKFLDYFGAKRLVHGHTPISKVTGQPPAEVTGPFIYRRGRCINVDGGLYLGGPGFVYRLELDE